MAEFSHRMMMEMGYKCSAAAEMGDRLATVDIGQKLGSCAPLGEVQVVVYCILLVMRLNYCYIMTIGHTYRVNAVPPFLGGWRAGSASSTMWPRPRLTSIQVAS